jgi:alpha-L-fucosidase 2
MRNKTIYLIASLVLTFCCFIASAQQRSMVYQFPLPRPHTGMIIGNGTQGLMIWGAANELNITIGHAGFWDHRGGNTLKNIDTFKDLKNLLYNADANGITKAFTPDPSVARPTQISGTRLQLKFPKGYTLSKGVLNFLKAEATIEIIGPKGQKQIVRIGQAVETQLAWVMLPQQVAVSHKLHPAWEWIGPVLTKAGISKPQEWKSENGNTGFTQTLPEDLPLGVAYRVNSDKIMLASYLGNLPEQHLDKILDQQVFDRQIPIRDAWWKKYWSSVPEISLPDPVLQEMLDFGLYKQACNNPPHAKAAGLQGPFMEDYQLPPWANDFHFNVNVQMIYDPALPSNQPDHLWPLWKMMADWLPKYRKAGEKFYGSKNALFFPHAVDDRGQVIGRFWTGIIDQGSAAWMAHLAWRHYRYTLDEQILNTIAWPLLEGSFEAYWATIEEISDGKGGKRLSLPVGVSPEFGRAYTGYQQAWGRDASFQLAALHRIARLLPQAAKILGKPLDPRWNQVEKQLPLYTLVDDVWMPEDQTKGERIALWDKQDLTGSHRHHSHLAGIFPFYVVDPKSKEHRDIVLNTMRNWVFKGSGNWMGWSVPWASSIWSRLENPEAAVMWLRYWNDHYVNKGKASLAFVPTPSQTIISEYPFPKAPETVNKEKMQMDAAMGAVSAVFELLVQHREDDVIAVLPAIYDQWQSFSFKNILAEGAFLLSAKVERGKVSYIKIVAKKGGKLKLEHGLGTRYLLNGKRVSQTAPIFIYESKVGEVIELSIDKSN